MILWRGGGRPIRLSLNILTDDVSLADPGSLRVRDNDRDNVSIGFQMLDEGEDVRGRLGGGRPVVVCYLVKSICDIPNS